jgi:uncharacterized iron-regulated membrane protein
MTVKKAIGKIHLWLGLASGLVVLFLGITGCMLAFQREIEMMSKPYQYVEPGSKPFLAPSRMHRIAAAQLPGKMGHSITYGQKDKAAVLTFYHEEPEYYYLVYLNPYSGKVLKVKNMDDDFFRILVDGHFYLWLPHDIGRPIVASATLIFVVMMISGIVLWWPKNKAARKQRFSVKWNAKWRRVNYDMHNVFGFYMSWVAIFIAITGLVWGFEWVSGSVYWFASGGDGAIAFYEPVSKAGKEIAGIPAEDRVFEKMKALYPSVETIEVHFPEHDSSAIGGAANPDASTFWQTDYRYFDRYTLEEIPVTHMYGRLKDTRVADKIARMNYDIHVGAIWGLPGKILAFCASLLAASLPVTGFLIWWGRKKKKKPSAKVIPVS